MSAELLKHPGLNLGAAHGETNDAAEELIFGFWVFLMSDAILFGLLFATYVTMVGATAGGPGPQDLYDIKNAFIETLVLLSSSFTFGMASLAMKYYHSRLRLVGWLGVTLVLGLVFLGFEVRDFLSMAEKGGVPSRSGFLSAFFAWCLCTAFTSPPAVSGWWPLPYRSRGSASTRMSSWAFSG